MPDQLMLLGFEEEFDFAPRMAETCEHCSMLVADAAHRRRVVHRTEGGAQITLKLCLGCAYVWKRTDEIDRIRKFAQAIQRDETRLSSLVDGWSE